MMPTRMAALLGHVHRHHRLSPNYQKTPNLLSGELSLTRDARRREPWARRRRPLGPERRAVRTRCGPSALCGLAVRAGRQALQFGAALEGHQELAQQPGQRALLVGSERAEQADLVGQVGGYDRLE